MSGLFPARHIVLTHDAPVVSAPISQGVVHNGVLYTGGQAGLDPTTCKPVAEDFESQARQALQNFDAVARAAGTSLDMALKVTVYLARMEDYPALNAIYARVFRSEPPARKVIETRLLAGLLVEFDAIIALPAGG